jgi:hypothetical protein
MIVAASVECYYHTDGLGYGEDNVCQLKVDRCSNGLLCDAFIPE